MWQNFKTKARDAKTLENQCKKTEGGPEPPEMGPIEAQVLAAIPNVMPTIDVAIDSDIIIYNKDDEADDDSQAWQSLNKRATTPTPEVHEVIQFEDKTPLRAKKRKYSDYHSETSSIEALKKIYLEELKNMKEKFEIEKKNTMEKHEAEMEILRIKKEIVLKELNNK